MDIIIPKVNESQEFIEIANDFSNPLDLVREGISNAYDAKATEIKVSFEVIKQAGENILKVILEDNGSGMDRRELQSFFDLGNSLRSDDPDAIGEKGHGTKIYYNSRKIIVTTTKNKVRQKVVMDEPYQKLHSKQIPQAIIEEDRKIDAPSGTVIEIFQYNNNRREKFSHEILKDYIMWFTKHGSFENVFFSEKFKNTILYLKGLGMDQFEKIDWGHYFPAESENINTLFNKQLIKAPDFYCKMIKCQGTLKNFPEIKYQAVFYIEGKQVKYDYNKMIRRPGYIAPDGAYTIQERYGLWLSKDFIPVQQKNEWISTKGREFTKFHAFFNCQEFKLTANRGSIDNTPSEILQDVQNEVKKTYENIINSDDWTAISWLEEEADAYQTKEKEKTNYEWRIKKVNRSNIASYKNLVLVEPERESGVLSLFLQLAVIEPNLFSFQVIDYDAHEGIDVIAKGDKTTPIASARLFYVEFKRILTDQFNHCFDNLHSIVCWDTEIKHDQQVTDIAGEKRKLQIIPPSGGGDYTKYYLDNPREAHKIEVFVLKDYLKQKLNIDFRPRVANAVI